MSGTRKPIFYFSPDPNDELELDEFGERTTKSIVTLTREESIRFMRKIFDAIAKGKGDQIIQIDMGVGKGLWRMPGNGGVPVETKAVLEERQRCADICTNVEPGDAVTMRQTIRARILSGK